MIAAAAFNPTFDPWRTIWFSPRLTIRRLLAVERPTWMLVFVLSLGASVLYSLNTWLASPATDISLARHIGTSLALWVAWFWPGVPLLARYGRWRGGRGITPHVRVAVVWSMVPVIVGALFWIPLWLVTGGEGVHSVDRRQPLLASVLYVVTEIGTYWSIIASVAMLAEVQRFSWWKAFESLMVVALLLGLVWYLTIVPRRPPQGQFGPAALISIPEPAAKASKRLESLP
jgi:hypothetical protein